MITYDSNIQAALDAGLVVVRGLMVFQFGSGTYRFVCDAVPLVWDGNTYHPNGLFKVSDLPGSLGFGAASFNIVLAASPDDGLTPEILLSIFNEDYRDRPVYIYDCYSNISTGQVIDAELLRAGYIDRLVYRKSEDLGPHIEFQCYSRSLDYGRKNGRIASHANQLRRNASDKFREHSAVAGITEIYWGRKKPNASS